MATDLFVHFQLLQSPEPIEAVTLRIEYGSRYSVKVAVERYVILRRY